MTNITIEDMEKLATELEANEVAQRARLTRLIGYYTRILGAREPERFRRVPTECADKDGAWDSSFPPGQVYRAYTGPRLLEISDNSTTDVATSGGFYYSWRRVTEHPGLWVARDGTLYGCEETGTGHLGQFAARPGDHDVDVTLEWEPRTDVELSELVEAESALRALAFPLSAAVA